MRSQIINLMLELQEKHGIAYIYVTQHLGMMKHISDQVLVMHEGKSSNAAAPPRYWRRRCTN